MKLLKHIKLEVEHFLNLTHRIRLKGRLKGIGFSPFSLNSCSLTDVLVFQKSLLFSRHKHKPSDINVERVLGPIDL